jgi:hypothetical protein
MLQCIAHVLPSLHVRSMRNSIRPGFEPDLEVFGVGSFCGRLVKGGSTNSCSTLQSALQRDFRAGPFLIETDSVGAYYQRQ